MSHAVKVVILASRCHIQLTERALLLAGFLLNKDFLVVNDHAVAEEHIKSGEKQLLITNGQLDGTVFVMKMMKKSPTLRAGTFSRHKGKQPQYQYRIRKMGHTDFSTLIPALKHFLGDNPLQQNISTN